MFFKRFFFSALSFRCFLCVVSFTFCLSLVCTLQVGWSRWKELGKWMEANNHIAAANMLPTGQVMAKRIQSIVTRYFENAARVRSHFLSSSYSLLAHGFFFSGPCGLELAVRRGTRRYHYVLQVWQVCRRTNWRRRLGSICPGNRSVFLFSLLLCFNFFPPFTYRSSFLSQPSRVAATVKSPFLPVHSWISASISDRTQLVISVAFFFFFVLFLSRLFLTSSFVRRYAHHCHAACRAGASLFFLSEAFSLCHLSLIFWFSFASHPDCDHCREYATSA